MPSLFKYFAFVGAALLGLMSLANFLLDPSTGATAVNQTPAKPAVVVEHDPRASKIERWRNEQAALRSSVSETAVTETAPATTAAAKAIVQPVAAPAQPVEQAHAAVADAPAAATPAAVPLQTSDASAITGVPTDDERAADATRLKAEKAKAAKARKARAEARLARQQAEQGTQVSGNQFYGGTQQRNASNQQDQFYYSQRMPRERQAVNAYAPRQQGFGPFGW